jgi:hypothetical protein
MTTKTTITDFELVDLGIEYPDYFQGFGCSFTRFEHCAYGIGPSPGFVGFVIRRPKGAFNVGAGELVQFRFGHCLVLMIVDCGNGWHALDIYPATRSVAEYAANPHRRIGTQLLGVVCDAARCRYLQSPLWRCWRLLSRPASS